MKSALTLLFLCLAVLAKAQQDAAFYIFDADQKPTNIKKAKFLLRVSKINDSSWQWDYYHFAGPMISREHFKDREGTIHHGTYWHYAQDGRLDSTAQFVNGKKHGDAYRLVADSFAYKTKYVFDNDQLVATVDMTKKDSSQFIKYDDEKESAYPGGLSSWGRYLNKNLRYPARAMDGNIQGQSVIGFMVDSDGKLSDPFIARSVEYSIDDEAYRIIMASGKWEPAFQNGRHVKSYKLQPIVFRLN